MNAGEKHMNPSSKPSSKGSMKAQMKALVITAPGINCDLELCEAFALAGCVGIPTSGGVETGPVIEQQLDPDFVIDPSGPRAGSGPESRPSFTSSSE